MIFTHIHISILFQSSEKLFIFMLFVFSWQSTFFAALRGFQTSTSAIRRREEKKRQKNNGICLMHLLARNFSATCVVASTYLSIKALYSLDKIFTRLKTSIKVTQCLCDL